MTPEVAASDIYDDPQSRHPRPLIRTAESSHALPGPGRKSSQIVLTQIPDLPPHRAPYLPSLTGPGFLSEICQTLPVYSA